MSNKFHCDYCDTTLSSRSNLLQHQKTAKYCLEKQGQINTDFPCDYCDKIFARKDKLVSHQVNCSAKNTSKYHIKQEDKYISEITLLKHENDILRNKIRDLEKDNEHLNNQHKEDKIQIRELQLSLEKLAQRGIDKHTTKTNNVHVNNTPTFVIDSVKFKEKIDENLTIDHVLDAPNGLADFICNTIIPPKDGQFPYTCTDAERRNFKFRDESGNEVIDKKGHMLWGSVKDPLFKTCGKLLIEKISDCEKSTDVEAKFEKDVCLQKDEELGKYKDGTTIMGSVAVRRYRKKNQADF